MLDAYHERIEEQEEEVNAAALEDLTVVIAGRSFRLGDLADIEVSESRT